MDKIKEFKDQLAIFKSTLKGESKVYDSFRELSVTFEALVKLLEDLYAERRP